MQLNALELRYSTLDSHRSTGISHAVSSLDKMTMASKTVTRSIVVTLQQHLSMIASRLQLGKAKWDICCQLYL